MSYNKARAISFPKSTIIELLDRHLHECNRTVAKVFDGMMMGMTTKNINSALGYPVSDKVTVITFERTIRAVRGDLAVRQLDQHTKTQVAHTLRMLIKRSDNEGILNYLEAKLEETEGSSDAKSRSILAKNRQRVERSQVQATFLEDPENRPGVYVYSYPNYIASEATSDDGRAYYKIGASNAGVAGRVKSQSRSTPMPEDIALLRVFYCEKPFTVEKQFHDILKAANMKAVTKKGGVEWFVTDLAFIDAIAAALRLDPGPRGSV